MKLACSRITAQGRVSIPAEVRERLGLAPGAIIEWDEKDGSIVVRRVHRFTSDDTHRALFPEGTPSRQTLGELKDGIRDSTKARHAGR